ncbi:hypothetical protein EDC22_104234 [Tepidamorphus gemmatus]|uniref:O-antigen ligase-related domain-containing protein n=1 Tax=Tepidamorphus gemmatus TaxID=747076 RepID=A0A4R3MEA4_9HYPH|nr:O-antigen ligase family protein [Tepidamorphus gemmatus]TCT11472.1 hypothetical protein EDC22_104234 [Tepidamorphus gemmatus]
MTAGPAGPACTAPSGDEIRRALLDRRLVRPILWLTILTSCFVTFEPSPYEFLFLLLLWAVLVRGLAFPRFIAPLILFLPVLFTIGGMLSVVQVVYDFDSVRYVAITMYLTVTTVVFASLVAENPVSRLDTIRSAYIIAAVIAALAGIAGYFHLFPGADTFTLYNRARGTFKDPNVYGPYLVFPALLLIQSMLSLHGRKLLFTALPLGIIVIGLLLSFSRAAWGNFLLATILMVAMMFLASPGPLFRLRMLIGAALGALLCAGLVIGILTIPGVGEVFEQRADLTQSYDVGEQGRFGNQRRAIPELLERPFGYGPLYFAKRFHQDPHNVYVNAFAAYGWLGGFSYTTFVVLTWLVGFRNVFERVPWQHYQMAALATFVAVSLQGFVVDTDHWRHFFMIAGVVWGMAAASEAVRRTARTAAMTSMPTYLRATI